MLMFTIDPSDEKLIAGPGGQGHTGSGLGEAYEVSPVRVA
jgi:hypothetical protein